LLAELLRQLLRDQPSGEIGHAAGRKRDDDLHRLGRVLLGECLSGNQQRRAERDGSQDCHHRKSSLIDRLTHVIGVARGGPVFHPDASQA
jgi:hypothetical protein